MACIGYNPFSYVRVAYFYLSSSSLARAFFVRSLSVVFITMERFDPPLRSVVLTILLLIFHATLISGTHLHGNHARDGSKTSAAVVLVEEGLSALSRVNKARVENPHFNKYKFQSGKITPKLAAALQPSSIVNNGTTQKRQNQANSTIETAAKSYSISPELADAARIMAEATRQVAKGNHSTVAATMKKKYAHKTNDTNVPPSHKTPEGRLSVYGDDHEAKSKRASAWWMVDMGSSGSSPFAPAGYKVGLPLLTRVITLTLSWIGANHRVIGLA